MASFPNAVKTFTTKNAGDVVQPADINDPQDEITALEDGYLNATARLNSSNSTVRALSVVGGSTFAGAIVIASTASLTAGGSVGTAGQFLQSNGSSGVLWASGAGGITTINSTWANVANSSAVTDALTFSMSSGTLADGDVIVVETIVKIRNGTAGAQTPTLKWFWGGANATLNTQAWSGPLAERIQRWSFALQRFSTSIAVYAPPANAGGNNVGWWSDATSATSSNSVVLISNSSFATATETVKLQIQLSTSDATHYINIQTANVYKIAKA